VNRGSAVVWELGLDFCELRTMYRPASDYPDDVTVYLVVNDFGKFGRAFVETGIAEADRETVIRNLLSGQYSNALRVIAFNTAEGWSRDVSEDIAGEVLERVFDADANLSEDTKLFIDRHMTPGEKRPPALSVRRGARTEHRAWRRKPGQSCERPRTAGDGGGREVTQSAPATVSTAGAERVRERLRQVATAQPASRRHHGRAW
jgi:hypothetical protein